MYLNEVSIDGYKNFNRSFKINLSQGLNVLVGENGVGKTAIIDAIRMLLLEDEFERYFISENDFFRAFSESNERAKSFKICGTFNELNSDEKVAYLPWTDLDGKATLTLLVDNKSPKGRYKRILWGGASRSSMFERELFDTMDCIYLPPLRDAEAKLREGKSSRLAQLLKNMSKKNKVEGEHPLVAQVKEHNKILASNDSIVKANRLIEQRLIEAIGSNFGQRTNIQFSEINLNRIVESLRLFFFPEIGNPDFPDMWRSLEENSLGYNNLLYLATVLAELTDEDDSISYKMLLIEEPEAHLHPQLQIRLLKFLEKTTTNRKIQIVVTTHSPVLASSASLDSLIHLSKQRNDNKSFIYTAIPLRNCGLPEKSKKFVSRWLDVTKSTLFFAKGVILVEGIAEAMLLPVFAKTILKEYNEQSDMSKKLPESLEDAGISVINMNGIYFRHFMPLFCNFGKICGESIPIRCAGITDHDPPTTIKEGDEDVPSKPTLSNLIRESTNHALDLIPEIKNSDHVRLYANSLKTFEYDMAMIDNNLQIMSLVAKSLLTKDGDIKETFEIYENKDWSSEKEETFRADAAYYLLNHIEKGAFAQALAEYLENNTITFSIPNYIKQAVIWACGGNPDDA